GDIVYLHMPGMSAVVVNSHTIATELLDRRGSIYSSRLKPVSLEMSGFEPLLGFLPYNSPFFNKHRRLFQKHFSHEAILSYQPLVIRHIPDLLRNILSRPEAYDEHFMRFASIVPCEVGFGFGLENNEEMAQVTRAALKTLNDSQELALVDFFPALKHFPDWFPGTSAVRRAREQRPWVRKAFEYPYNLMRAQFEVNMNASTTGLEEKADPVDLAYDLQGVVASIITGGIDTVWSSMSLFIIFIAMHPEVQQAAQAELDSVLKGVRLPEFSDQSSLPYIDCILMEIKRDNFHPAMLGVPHLCTENDVYNGYLIPKGTLIIPNAKAMGRDRRIYKDPEQFNPARFLPRPHGDGEPPYTSIFGYGRRICPGRYLADAELFIVIASVLAVFDIRLAMDSNGEEVKPKIKMSSGFIKHPVPVACNIRLRSPAFARLLQDSA
ncbi:cytochrome P450, partial [Fistulina hepatica ATCC 64428]